MDTDNEDPIIGGAEPLRRRGRPPGSGLRPAEIVPQEPTATAAPKTTYKEEDPRARAARRSAELMDHLGTLDRGVDEFFIDPRIIPESWSYEWKRHTTFGKEDPSYQVSIAQSGWEAVPTYRHPFLMPEGYDQSAAIIRKGMILMERPLQITQAIQKIESRKAVEQVRQKEEQLTGSPAGPNSPFDPTNKGNPMVKINRSYESISIPKE